MSDFVKLSQSHRIRIDELAAHLTRVEIHVRRGEKRAAKARLELLYREMEAVLLELSLPLDFVVAGANLGLLSGKGSLLRGRLPAMCLGGLAGWMAGQAVVLKQRRFIEDIFHRAAEIDDILGAREAQE